MKALVFSLSLYVTSALASPLVARASTGGCQSPYGASGDAPYTVPCSTLAAAITCPRGVGKSAGGTVLLVPGTGYTAVEAWQNGPYNVYLPNYGKKYDICWVETPDLGLGDMQVTAEYVAYAIGQLASTSTTKNVAVIGHSQGAGCNPQWALLYWPSTRAKVYSYVALAGDFHGTGEGDLVCAEAQIAQGGCEPSVWQQSVGSHYYLGQNTHGNQALVPTTSLYTEYDDVIQPENPPAEATSNLPGASVIYMQQTNVCGPAHVVDHFGMLVDPAAYSLALDALTHGGEASVSRFNSTFCTYYVDNVFLSNPFGTIPSYVSAIASAAIAVGAETPKTRCEPPLMPYVCEANGFPQSYCQNCTVATSPLSEAANGIGGFLTGTASLPKATLRL